MRILHVYKDYWPVLGGIENHIKLLAEAQVAAGHDVTVLVTSRDRHSTVECLSGVRVVKAARLAHVASTPISLRLPWLLRGERPHITHLHFPYPLGEMSNYLFGAGRPAVLTYHSDVVRQARILRLYRPLMRRALRRVRRIIVTTPHYLESSATLAEYRGRCVVIPLGIDREPFLRCPPEAGQELRRRLGNGPVLLFVGMLRYYKGLQYLLEAMPNIVGRLVIVGEGPEGATLASQARDLGLQDRVLFAGRVPDSELPAYYRAADLFVLPASERSEAFGLVQVEAMTCGLPVVCTEVGTGTTFVNRHGETGLVVPPKDPASLADAINTLLTDHELRARLGRNALARSELFSKERMLADIQALYDRVLAETNP